ncbi:MAG: rRNA maturation RNase YbeY [Candidatus Marinimicrobia bacterium]|nr:rRNA maturation RNase YbeY [Candidatus Neomarinimicrobiota bacterium]MBL7059608.1 rRNA maturation RNase YbeY [Candidatus Neomarinimicrobiota bacterium]
MISIHSEIDPTIGSLDEPAAQNILRTVLSGESVTETEITLILGSDDLLSNLKREFFHVNQFTDVIAFRLNDYDEPNIEGEIYISLPRANENAKIYENSLNKEVARLIIHGGLHLMDYKDDTEEQKQVMRDLENTYLEKTDWVNLKVTVS